MGDFRITVEGVGGHGCDRLAKPTVLGEPGAHVNRCRRMDCPDCRAIDFVDTLKRSGCSVSVAKLEHWPVPGAAGTTRTEDPGPVDDLLSGMRDRSF